MDVLTLDTHLRRVMRIILSPEEIIHLKLDKTSNTLVSSAKVARSRVETIDKFDTEITALQKFLEYTGVASRPEFDSLGIWHRGNAANDIIYSDVWSCEPITSTVDIKHHTYRMPHIYFTKIGDLSTTPSKTVANVNGILGPICGGIYYIDKAAKPHLLASHHSNGDVMWPQTRGSCLKEGFNYAARKLTVRAQRLNESVKVGVQKDDEKEMVYELMSTEDSYENFTLMGFVHASEGDVIIENMEDAEDMTNVPTSV